MTDYSTTCPMTFLAEMVEGGSFPKELFDKLKEAQEEEDEDSRDLINDLEDDRDKWEAVAGISEDIIKKLQEQNKKLQEENKNLQEELDNEESAEGLDLVIIKNLQDELLASNTALQIVKDENEVNKKNMFKFMKENKDLKKEIAHKNKKFGEWCEENKKLEAELKELKEECFDDSESDEEEELSKYEKEGSDWARAYGFSVKDGEYRAVMAGGGDHWEDYVIKRDGCFIHNGCGYSAVAQFISCPEANYIKVVHIGATYELEEGETDMYEMITESYQEEIMDYELKSETETEEEEEEEYIENKIIVNDEGNYEVVEEAKEMTRAERKQKWKEEHKK